MRDMLWYCPSTPDDTHLLDSRVCILVIGSGDNLEGMRSFMAKRSPNFAASVDKANFPFWPWWRAEGIEEKAPKAKI
jgi:hypothetical protein